jgi:hypothetical protein
VTAAHRDGEVRITRALRLVRPYSWRRRPAAEPDLLAAVSAEATVWLHVAGDTRFAAMVAQHKASL